jgi:hypothetical protein
VAESPALTFNTEDFTALAIGKLTRVLGPERGARVYAETLEASNMKTVTDANDLYVFAESLASRGGIEAAVAGLLSVAAVMRGAAPPRK